MAIFTIDYSSAALKRRIQFTAVLPVDSLLPDYSDFKDHEFKTFKTLYLLHGYSGDCTDWLTHCNTKNWATKYNCAIIMPSGDNSFYVDYVGGRNNYGQLIGQELVEVSRKCFPLSHKKEDTFIAGLSMGGFGALRNGLKYYDNFSYIASFSGGLSTFEEMKPKPNFEEITGKTVKDYADTDDNPRFLVKEHVKNKTNDQKIWISCGTKDSLYNVNAGFRDYLIESGYDVTWDELPLAHEWAFWSDQLEKIGQWLPLGAGSTDNLSRLDK